MPISDCDVRDPRMKRTRQLLQGALRKLLQEKPFDEILVQDITQVATVNRATFYDHYTDKFALFEAMVAGDFHKLMEERNIRFDGACSSSMEAILLTVCDYLQQVHSNKTQCVQQGSFSPLMDAAITRAIRLIVLNGLLGVVYGIVFLRYGVVCAVLAHLGTDLVWHSASQLLRS